MRKFLPKTKLKIYNLKLKKIFFLFFIFYILSFVFTSSVQAQIQPPYGGGLDSKVAGTVGEYYLNIAGFASPFSSISLYIDNVFIRSTSADQYGNFSISEVLIKRGLSKFCLKAIDYKQLGESNTCLSIPPAKGSVTIKDIFLPPTLALLKNQIPEGSSTIAYGYTMPGAKVTLHLSNGNKLTTKADSSGYFEFILKNLKAGKYTLYATAKYKDIDSLVPSKKLDLTVWSKTGQAIVKIGNFWDWLWKLLTSWGLGPLWLAIPIIILIIILILKLLPGRISLWPVRFTGIFYNPTLVYYFDLLRRRKKPLHHKWMVGY